MFCSNLLILLQLCILDKSIPTCFYTSSNDRKTYCNIHIQMSFKIECGHRNCFCLQMWPQEILAWKLILVNYLTLVLVKKKTTVQHTTKARLWILLIVDHFNIFILSSHTIQALDCEEVIWGGGGSLAIYLFCNLILSP